MNAETDGKEERVQDVGKLVLRITIAGLMLFHGVAKLTGGIDGIKQTVTGAGLPEILAYGVYVGEVVAPLLMILGLLTRISGVIFAFNMFMAIMLSHRSEIFSVGQFGGWKIELQMLYLLGAVSVVLLGPGRYAVRPTRGWLA